MESWLGLCRGLAGKPKSREGSWCAMNRKNRLCRAHSMTLCRKQSSMQWSAPWIPCPAGQEVLRASKWSFLPLWLRDKAAKACPLGFLFLWPRSLWSAPCTFLQGESRLFHLSIHLFIHPLSKYLLSTYYVSGTVLGAEATATQKTDKVIFFMELTF